jgi:hypothetical protein
MKYLKKYHELLENKKLKDFFYGDNDEVDKVAFKKFIRIASEYEKNNTRTPSYNELCVSPDMSPKEDLDEFMIYLSEHGFYEERILKLIKLYEKEILNSHLSLTNGILDIFLYYYFGKSYYLSSGTFKFDPIDYSAECIIKYLYGYQNTSYGKLFIENIYGDSKEDSKEIIDKKICSEHAKKTWQNNFLIQLWETIWYDDDFYGLNMTTSDQFDLQVDKKHIKNYALKVLQVNPKDDKYVVIDKKEFYKCCAENNIDENFSTNVFNYFIECLRQIYSDNLSNDYNESKIIIK